jgi:hypothetical protein
VTAGQNNISIDRHIILFLSFLIESLKLWFRQRIYWWQCYFGLISYQEDFLSKLSLDILGWLKENSINCPFSSIISLIREYAKEKIKALKSNLIKIYSNGMNFVRCMPYSHIFLLNFVHMIDS